MSAMMSNGNLYQGRRESGDAVVTVNGKPLDLRLDLYNHSPTGFEWGYGGSGPAQLALAILANEVTDQQALDHYQQFKWDMIAGLEKGCWILSGKSVHDWLLRRIYDQKPMSVNHG